MTDFDFPVLDAPPAIAPTPVAIATPLPTLPEVPSIKATVLAQFKEAEGAIVALAEKYRDVAYDVSTTKGMREATAARLDLRENGRFAVQRAERAVKADVNDLKRVMAEEVDRLVAIVQPVEDAIDTQIKAEEVRKAAAKAERDRIESERVTRHQAGVDKIRGYLVRCQGADMTADRIGIGIGMLEGVTFGPEWQEFAVPAANALCETLEAMRTLHAHAVEREAAAALLEAQRVERETEQARQAAENARLAAELAERQRALDAQAAEFAANMARINGHQRRIAEIHAAATGHAGKSVWELFEVIVAVGRLDTSESEWQEMAPLAATAQASTLAALNQLHATALAREEVLRVAVLGQMLASAPPPVDDVIEAAEPSERERADDEQRADAYAQAIAGTQAMPAPMLQDESHDLSLALSTAPHAHLNATEASAAIAAAKVVVLSVDGESPPTLSEMFYAAAVLREAYQPPAADLLGDPVAAPVEEDGSELEQCRAALAQCRAALADACYLLDGWITSSGSKKYAAEDFAHVAYLRDMGGLPRVTPTTPT